MHSSILLFVVFMGVLGWGWSWPPGHPSVTFGDSVPPLALRATSPVSGESVLEGEPSVSKSLPLRGRCPEGAEGENLAIARNISDSRTTLSPTACGRSPLAEGAKG